MKSPDIRAWFAGSGRRKAIVSGAVTVFVLAAVLIGIAAFGPEPGGPGEGQSSATQPDRLASLARESLASGDATEAIRLAEKALALDSSHIVAKSVLSDAKDAQDRSSDGTNGGSQDPDDGGPGTDGDEDPADPDAFDSPIPNMLGLLPATFKDYQLTSPVQTEGQVQVSATPATSKYVATQVVWVVHEMDDGAAADAFVESVSKELYGTGGGAVDIDGVDAYFGTDGTRYATVTYVRGRYVFEVLATGTGVDPAKLKDIAATASKAFADEPPR